MKILSSILIASVLVMGVLAVMPAQQAFAGHVVTANSVGSGITGLSFTDDGTITDLDDNTVTFGESVTITTGGLTITAGNLDMTDGQILNIGAAGTDFSGTGGLTLADALTVNAGAITASATSPIQSTAVDTGGAIAITGALINGQEAIRIAPTGTMTGATNMISVNVNGQTIGDFDTFGVNLTGPNDADWIALSITGGVNSEAITVNSGKVALGTDVQAFTADGTITAGGGLIIGTGNANQVDFMKIVAIADGASGFDSGTATEFTITGQTDLTDTTVIAISFDGGTSGDMSCTVVNIFSATSFKIQCAGLQDAASDSPLPNGTNLNYIMFFT